MRLWFFRGFFTKKRLLILFLAVSGLLLYSILLNRRPGRHEVPEELLKKPLPSHSVNFSSLTCDSQWPPDHVTLTTLSPPVERSCPLLWSGDKDELLRVKRQLASWKNSLSDETFVSLYLSGCSSIRHEFDNFYVSKIEKDFPLAFLVNVHTSLQQVFRFLKSIYRPHNIYCFHVDVKSSSVLRSAFSKLASCLPNVVIASKVYDVMYASIDQIDALRSCYKELLRFDGGKWKYAINVCGRELPLKTNREMVETLLDMKYVNVVNPGVSLDAPDTHPDIRKRILYRIRRRPHGGYSNEPLGPVPLDIPVYKNNTFVALTRPFVQFMFSDDTANDFYLFLRDTRFPDEQYFTTLNRLPSAPGGYDKLVQYSLLDILPQVSVSYWIEGVHSILPQSLKRYFNVTGRCHDKFLAHSVCIGSSGDLQSIKVDFMNSRVFFFNKYFEEYDHVIMDCVEEELLLKNKREFVNDCALKNSQQKL